MKSYGRLFLSDMPENYSTSADAGLTPQPQHLAYRVSFSSDEISSYTL